MRRADDRQASAIGRNVITSPHHGPSGMQATRAVRHAYRGPSGMQDKICRFSRRRLDGNDLPASRHEKQSGRLAASERAHDQGKPLGPSGMQADACSKWRCSRRRSGGPSGMQTGTRRQNVAPRAIRSLATLRAARCPPPVLLRRYVRLKRTNLRVIGLSLNRSQKRSALLSTTPRLRTRSSTNDLAPLRRMWLLSLRHTGAFVGARQEPSCCGFATAGAEIGRPAYIVASRRKRR